MGFGVIFGYQTILKTNLKNWVPRRFPWKRVDDCCWDGRDWGCGGGGEGGSREKREVQGNLRRPPLIGEASSEIENGRREQISPPDHCRDKGWRKRRG